MRPIIVLLIRLYPARWRARYGDEFAAVLDERPLGPFDVADVLLGALDAHLHLRGLGAASQHAKGFAMSLRIGGYAAIVSGLLWLYILAGNAINNGAESGAPFIGIVLVVATVTTLAALVGLSAFQSRRHPVLVWVAFAVPAVGAVVGLLGMAAAVVGRNSDAAIVGDVTAWMISTIGLLTLLVGSALFALATLVARSLSQRAAALLGIGALLVPPALMGVLGGLIPPAVGYVLLIVAILAFPAGWVALGISALRLGRTSHVSLEGASA
jgi:hypothetical protein